MTVENLEINVSKVGDAAATSIGKLSKNVDGLKESASKSTGALGKLAASIKRIAFYRVLRSALKNVAKAFDEGLKNAYHFSEAVGYRLAATMDTIATKSLTMKNQMGAAFGGLIQAVEPILLRIISLITQAANAIAAFFGAFNGGEYLRAKDTAVAWDDANKSAGAYKRTILGFDEINRLDSPSGGGGANALDYASMFEIAEAPYWLQDLAVRIKDVLFNWDDLNKEQIAAKLLTGLGAATGGIIGFALGGAKGAVIGTILGIVLGATLSSLIFNGDGKLSEKEVLKSLVSALAIIAGGVIGFSIGNIAGAAIGMAIGAAISFAINGISFAIEERKRKAFYDTELGKLEKQLEDRINERNIRLDELSVKIDSLTGEIDESTNIKLSTAAKLVQQIFDLDSIKNKTPEQIEILKNKIELLNGLSLDEIQLSFDETTGKVSETRESVEKLIESIKDQYELEALRDSIIKAYQAQTEAELDLVEAEDDLKNAISLKREQEEIATEAQNAFNDALEEYNNFLEDGGLLEEDGAKKAADLKLKLWDLEAAWEAASSQVGIFDETISDANESVEKARDVLDKANEKVDLLEDKLTDITSKQYTITVNANLPDLEYAIPSMLSSYQNDSNNFGPRKFANGGIVDQGTLFIAGEAGAEIVSSNGGTTQVSNTDQIAASVQSGNGIVVNAIYAMANAIVSSVERKDTNPVVTIGDRDVYRAWERGSSAVGGSLVHG